MPNEIGLITDFQTKKTDKVYKAKPKSNIFTKKIAKKPFRKKAK